MIFENEKKKSIHMHDSVEYCYLKQGTACNALK